MKSSYSFERRQQRFFHLLLESMIKLNDPFWKKINISHIKMSKNFRSCQIFYTVFGKLITLNEQIWKSKILVLKKVMAPKWLSYSFPELVFIHDKALLEAEKIIDILNKLKNENKTS